MKPNEKYTASIFGKPRSVSNWIRVQDCEFYANMDLSACKKELENCLDDYTGNAHLFDFKNTRWKTDWEYKGMLFDLESDSEDPIFTVRPSLKRLHDQHVSWLINQAKSRFDAEEIARLMLKYKKNPKKLKKSKIDAELVRRAKVIGAEAFARGKRCVPAQDARMMALIGEVPKSESSSENVIAMLNAWNRGWTEANLAAPWEESR